MLVGTSFKMNKTRPQAREWVAGVLDGLPDLGPGDEVFVIPPFTAISAVKDEAADSPLLVGAQNVNEHEEGAFTGEVSTAMLAELGCDIVEIGHSERRALYGETDESVAAKTRRILAHGMRPLICIGEDTGTRAHGRQLEFVLAQAEAAIGGLEAAKLSHCWLAYEPVWAIGVGGKPATPEQVAPIHIALSEAYPDTPVLYGGSVAPGNARELAATDGVAGLFVGRAALEPEGFLSVLLEAMQADQRSS